MSMKNTLSFIWEIIKIVIIALLIVIPIRYFLFQPFLVRGQSMEPNFENGDYLIIDEISYRLKEPQRGEVIVFRYPDQPSQRFIKRIIGLPGETIEIKDGKVMIIKDDQTEVLDESQYLPKGLETKSGIQGDKFSIPDNKFFVLGDNRSVSADSRSWGLLPRENIIGRVYLRIWPFTAFAKVEKPIYEIP
jgi:signal peptidase I